MKATRSFIAALGFLTRLPVSKVGFGGNDISSGLWAFPIVGLIIGLLLSLSSIPIYLFVPLPLASGILLVMWIWITGGLHIDGFIDCCDALFSTKPWKDRLEIMKDVAAGSFGVTGAVLFLIIKYGALASIRPDALLVILPMAAVAGRSAMLFVIYRFPYARETGIGKIMKEHVGIREHLVSFLLLFGVAVAFIFSPCPFYLGFASIVAAFVFCEIFGFWVMKRIPGFTGDVYGATCELVEALILVLSAIVLKVAA
jgi:adenosylcobinamide-GDP ribazoletransferase